LDAKIVLGDITAQSFPLVAHSSTVPATVSSRFVGKYDLIMGIADAATALRAGLFRYLGSEHKERRFLSWGD
jgi:hypothetical protein